MPARLVVLGLSAMVLCACSTVDMPPAEHISARSVELDLDPTQRLTGKELTFIALRTEMSPDFIGCLMDTAECFVGGRYVNARIRFEPQTGRFWFLDPGSGNTYFINGELRTDDGFRAREQMIPREGIYPEPAA